MGTARKWKQQELINLKEEVWRQRNRGSEALLGDTAVQRPPTQRFQPQQLANSASNHSCITDFNRHCTAYPHCKCIKAKGPQSCKLSGSAVCWVHAGDCLYRRSGAG